MVKRLYKVFFFVDIIIPCKLFNRIMGLRNRKINFRERKLKGEFFWGNRRVKLLQKLRKNNIWISVISFFILCIFFSVFSIIKLNLFEKLHVDQEDIKIFSFISKNNQISKTSSTIEVIPSGESIGVKIESKGVLVVGLSTITDVNGKKVCPAAESGFAVGDKIININGQKVENEKDIIEIINEKGKRKEKVKVTVERKGKQVDLIVKPVQSNEDRLYKIGLWVRDNIAGVGTMTFYEPSTGIFAALGHGITDVDTGVLIDINRGSISKAKVISIQKAKKAAPGEIVGLFNENNDSYGTILKNTKFGIYGVLEKKKIDHRKQAIPVALNYQIKEGPAKILTTIENNKVEEFDIEIQKIFRQQNINSKSMIIKVTDKRLIEKTGGIIQGMSGSPIIQNGMLVGAVTHVLINDPLKGYGIFADWMLKEANIIESLSYKKAAGQ